MRRAQPLPAKLRHFGEESLDLVPEAAESYDWPAALLELSGKCPPKCAAHMPQPEFVPTVPCTTHDECEPDKIPAFCSKVQHRVNPDQTENLCFPCSACMEGACCPRTVAGWGQRSDT